MNSRLFTFSLMLLVAGCAGPSKVESNRSQFVFPDSHYVRGGTSCQLDDLKKTCRTDETGLQQALRELGAKDPMGELNDPFIRERLPFVTFWSPRPGREIAKFYRNVFEAAGWKGGRGILHCEWTNGGGDWVHVFTNGNRAVHVHIIGPMANTSPLTPGWSVDRTITLRFRRLSPTELLGANYQRQGMEAKPSQPTSTHGAAGRE